MPDVLVQRSPEDLLRYVKALSNRKVFTEPDPEYDTALRECLRMAMGE